MRQPGFWAHGRGGATGRLLAPLAWVTTRLTARRVVRAGFTAPIPVICCGNATVGGAGKTTLALDVAARFAARGVAVHLLTRGFGGSARGVTRVDPDRHSAADVGDEALLLAEVAPTWVAVDRAAGARAAVAAGADLLVMDDGLQNPTLTKSLSLLVVDGATGFGNGRVLPAGPLREPVPVCAGRTAAAVLIGADLSGARRMLPARLPVHWARLRPAPLAEALRGRRVLAFAGIAHPAKFFGMLSDAGVHLVETREFADHHAYSAADADALIARASALEAVPVTTPKDHVRLSLVQRDLVVRVGVSLAWEDEASFEALLDTVPV